MMKESIQTCNGKRKIENATLTLQQSKHIWEKFGILIPVGAGTFLYILYIYIYYKNNTKTYH